jgi:hypothetical protein
MKETNAPLAGEMSGHIFFKHLWYGFDDALNAAIPHDPRGLGKRQVANRIEVGNADFGGNTGSFASRSTRAASSL